MKTSYKIFSTSNSISLAKGIAKALNLELGQMNTQIFSDGEINVVFEESIRRETVIIVAQAQLPYANLFELFIAVDAARRASAREIICIIPYLPHSRQERKDDTRSSISSRLIADFIEHSGADRVVTLDMHSTAIMGFYKIPIEHISMHSIFEKHIQQNFDLQTMCLCSPDFGGLKRIKAYKKNLDCEMAVIHKERLSANQVSNMEIIGSVKDKNIIIIDDMVDTGGTLCKAAEKLKESGARSVTAYCTHGVLSGDALEKVGNSKIDKLIISDSVVHTNLPSNIEQLSCIPLLSKTIEFVIQGKSLKDIYS